jgi:cyclopropane fatty-acyl-phospholipid synthase-like methyltransferase
MALPNAKNKIIEHYDVVSPYYYKLWGEHLHHGYWIRGDESKEKAQKQLIEHLARLAQIPYGATVLDVGCGFGASSLYLCKQFGATTTGITISQVQVEMASAAAVKDKAPARYCLMDAESMTFEKPFDVLWSVESISHYQDREKFFASAAKLLRPGGIFALTDWFKKPNLSSAETRKLIHPIEQGMFVRLEEMGQYEGFLRANGMEIVRREELTKHCAHVGCLPGHHCRCFVLGAGREARAEFCAVSELFPRDARRIWFGRLRLWIVCGSKARSGYPSCSSKPSISERACWLPCRLAAAIPLLNNSFASAARLCCASVCAYI